MHYYKFKADWQKEGDKITELIDPFRTPNNYALMYNSNPEINDVYIAAEDGRMIYALEKEFDLTELDDINYGRDFIMDNSRTWGVTGNNFLINF